MAGMPDRVHLRRLPRLWVKQPIYFLTTCTHNRQPFLTQPGIAQVLIESWRASSAINGWIVGRYVVMPDHAHFFATRAQDRKSLSEFMRDWKRWTAGAIKRALPILSPVWQSEFFDHVCRSAGSYEEKWDYVRENPVRAGLVKSAADWPHAGECAVFGFKL